MTTAVKRISHHHPPPLVLFILLLLSLSSIADVFVSGEILQLTAENFHEAVEGKSVFISFVASWCGEACDDMQETWSRLSDDWKDHAIGLVAQVDCSDLSNVDEDDEDDHFNPICAEYGIDAVPAVIYGDPASPELLPEDQDLTDYNALSMFCQDTISQPTCSFQRLSHCPEAQRVILQDLLTKTRDELEAMESHVEERLQQQQEIFDVGLQKINDNYKKLVDEYNTQIETIRQETHYKWVQQVLGDMDHKAEAANANAESSSQAKLEEEEL